MWADWPGRTGSSGTPQRSASKSPVPRAVPRRPRSTRGAGAGSGDSSGEDDDTHAAATKRRARGPDERSAKARKYMRINA